MTFLTKEGQSLVLVPKRMRILLDTGPLLKVAAVTDKQEQQKLNKILKHNLNEEKSVGLSIMKLVSVVRNTFMQRQSTR